MSAYFYSGARRLAVFATAMLLLSDVAVAQQDEALRERTERVADILTALGARDGTQVADLGSSDGFYTLLIAKAVAPSDKAYAIDIDQKSFDKLRERAQQDAVTNVEIVLRMDSLTTSTDLWRRFLDDPCTPPAAPAIR